MHLTIFPVAFIDCAVGPFVLAMTFHVFVHKSALIIALVRPREASLTMFVSKLKAAGIRSSIGKSLGAMSVEMAFPELAFECVSIFCIEPAHSVLFIIRPVASVNTGIPVDFAAQAVYAILAPIAFVDGSIWKDLCTSSVAHFLGALGE